MFFNRFFFLLCTHGIPWANYSVVFPEKVWQCCNAAVWYEHCIMEFLYTIEPLKGKQNSTTLWGQSWLVKSLRQKPHLHVQKKNRHSMPIFGTVLTILRHGTPNFRRVNISVPNVMWHQCSKF